MTTITTEPRPVRYMRTLDEELAPLANGMRQKLLNQQLNFWTRAYGDFVRAIDTGHLDPSPAGPSIDDYLEIIAAIQTRQGGLR